MKITSLVAMTLILGNVGCASTPKLDIGQSLAQRQCEEVGAASSLHADQSYQIQFFNSRKETVDLYWINYKGEEELKQTLMPSGQYAATTYITHPWVVRDQAGRCLAFFNSDPAIMVDIR